MALSNAHIKNNTIIYRKRINMKLIFKVLAIAVMSLAMAHAQKVMRVGSWMPPANPNNATIFPELKKQIEKVTNGRVIMKVEFGLGHPKDMFDLVEDGVIDASWSYHGFMPGRFLLAEFAELPIYQERKGGEVSLALWDVYNKYFKQNGEYDGLYLAALWVHPPGQIHLKEPISSLDDLRNKKIRIGGGMQKYVGDLLGVSGVSAPGSKVYEILQQRVADGSFMPYEARESARLKEVAPYVAELNMYYGNFGFVISQDFLDQLSAEDRNAILALTGRNLSQYFGSVWHDYSARARKKADPKYIISSPEMDADFKNRTKNLASEWVERASVKNANAQKALTEFRQQLGL